MTITLITGANRGLGYETARRLVLAGHDVYIGARDRDRGKRAADEVGATFLRLDVTDQESVESAVERVREEHGRLDVLVNNAGIAGVFLPPRETVAEHLRQVYDVNVFGAVRASRAFLPLLERADRPVIVNVSSGMGSFAVNSDPDRMESGLLAVAYTSSKTALNMITAQYAKALPDVRVNAVDPGYTATDMNQHSGQQTVQEGADAIVQMATLDDSDERTGVFVDRYGTVPW